ncbi:uncharacterized protein METZ01_LOCUS48196 [marine metagenome]|uniref:Uncharacterized protein n=1 Tax=marine metagenome TaxID=408172 RepID=A0A381RTZ7_9ZZZZ
MISFSIGRNLVHQLIFAIAKYYDSKSIQLMIKVY